MARIYKFDYDHAQSVLGPIRTNVMIDLRECKAIYDDPIALEMQENLVDKIDSLGQYLNDQT